MADPLPFNKECTFGVMSVPFSAAGAKKIAQETEEWGYDALFVGDHISFTAPMLDPFVSLTAYGAHTKKIKLGVAVYLLALRRPIPVAKQIVSTDLLTDGRLIFGVGVGGEFKKEYEVCGVPIKERGRRTNESLAIIREVLGKGKASYDGEYLKFENFALTPKPKQKGGVPIWIGGRSDAALIRTGKYGDGYMSYILTPERLAESYGKIAVAAEEAGREFDHFDTGHLTFINIAKDYETAHKTATQMLSMRYAMDFSEPAKKYCILGTADDCIEQLAKFKEAGLRFFLMDPQCQFAQRDEMFEQLINEIAPKVRDA